MPYLIAAILALLSSFARAGESPYIWWEAESPLATNFPRRSWFSPSTFADKKSELSGDDWLSNSGKRSGPAAFARYQIEVPADATYHFWTRKFWSHGPFRYRFDNGPWRSAGRDIALADTITLRTHVTVNWVSLGHVELRKGMHTFELELLANPGDDLTAAFDCFVLSSVPFVPGGKLKPGQKLTRAEPGFFATDQSPDAFSPDALLDLRHLNENIAGQSGFVRRDNDRFLLGNGTPVRFWAVNVGMINIGRDRPSVDYLARKLAKLGVNMVRIHGTPFKLPDDPQQTQKAIDDIHYAVAAFRQQGIYSGLSFYFPLWFDLGARSGYAGYEQTRTKHPFALLYFEPRFQAIYRDWAKRLLQPENPYTKRSLAQDPAVAIVELVNEDSFFFHTFSQRNFAPAQWDQLQAQFGQWLAQRYGSLDKALAEWNNTRLPADNPAKQIVGLYDIWNVTARGLASARPGQRKRASDQVRFLTHLQRSTYESLYRYLKEDLKVGGLISASNWVTADPPTLGALEHYTYAATDIIDRHGYFSGKHEGDGASYSIRVGHAYQDAPAVLQPERLPIQTHQVEGYPQMISELGWSNPNRFRADATFIASAYGALQGIDALFFFAVGSNYLRDPAMNKFAVSSPVIAGAFPAAALQYRRGDVQTADVVVYESLNLEDLLALKGSGSAAADALDQLRQRDIPQDGIAPGPVRSFDPLSFYAGRVVKTFGRDPARSYQRDLSPFIDRDQKLVRSITQELSWNHERGLIRVSTPRSQGAAGFLAKAGSIDLPDVSIDCRNDYAAILVVSLDNRPLAASRRMLVQSITEERPYGFKAENGSITDIGSPPLQIRQADVTITLSIPAARIVPLDEHGNPRPALKPAGPAIKLSADSLYHILER